MRLFQRLITAQVVVFTLATLCKGETFDVDTRASRVFSRVDAIRLGHNHGIEGKLRASSMDLRGTGGFVIDMTSFSADTPSARAYVGLEGSVSASNRKQTTANMHSSDVLDVARFPTASFEIKSIMPISAKTSASASDYTVTGTFTLHGVKRPLTFTAKVEPVNGAAPGTMRMRGSFVVKQTDYGMTPYSAFGGIAKVANEVKIWGDIVLVPATAPVASKQNSEAAR